MQKVQTLASDEEGGNLRYRIRNNTNEYQREELSNDAEDFQQYNLAL